MASYVPVICCSLLSSARRSNEQQQQPLLLAGDDALHCRMERGEAAGTTASSKFRLTFSRYLAAAGSIAMLVALFVIRYLDLEPQLRDPYKLMIVGIYCLVPGMYFFVSDGEDEVTHP